MWRKLRLSPVAEVIKVGFTLGLTDTNTLM